VSMREFDPTSFILYYVDAHNRQAIVAGNHRILAKKVLFEQSTPDVDPAPDMRLSVIKLSSRIPPLTILRASSGTQICHPSCISYPPNSLCYYS